MEKFIIKSINNYNYQLVDKSNKISEVNLEFLSNYHPQVNDTIYMDRKLLNEHVPLTFGPLEDIYGHSIEKIITNHEDSEIINIKNNEVNIYLKRFYG